MMLINSVHQVQNLLRVRKLVDNSYPALIILNSQLIYLFRNRSFCLVDYEIGNTEFSTFFNSKFKALGAAKLWNAKYNVWKFFFVSIFFLNFRYYVFFTGFYDLAFKYFTLAVSNVNLIVSSVSHNIQNVVGFFTFDSYQTGF